MMKRKLLTLTLILFGMTLACPAQQLSGTYHYASRDTCELYLDLYRPTPGSELTYQGQRKPTLLFVFGGGFIAGSRNDEYFLPWFKLLNDNGYQVSSIDYRLGLKGVKMDFSPLGRIRTARHTIKAEYMGVEDLFSAVNYIIAHREELDVDPAHIVLAGSSAGAIISLAAEQAICNDHPLASVLPAGFNFRGLISFAGAIVGDEGTPVFRKMPCPILLLHGTEDATVQYGKTQVLKLGIWGSDVLDDVLRKRGANYCIYRFLGHSHDIAANFVPLWPYQQYFLQENVIGGKPVHIDARIDDLNIPKWEAPTLDSLY